LKQSQRAARCALRLTGQHLQHVAAAQEAEETLNVIVDIGVGETHNGFIDDQVYRHTDFSVLGWLERVRRHRNSVQTNSAAIAAFTFLMRDDQFNKAATINGFLATPLNEVKVRCNSVDGD
jgi:hypothetical protein